MPRNRKIKTNAIEIGPMAKLMVVFVLIGVFGLVFVYIKRQQYNYGAEYKRLEKHLVALHKRDDAVSVQIVRWSSRTMLKRRLEERFIVLQPITNERIVRLHQSGDGYSAGDLRMVSNQMSYE